MRSPLSSNTAYVHPHIYSSHEPDRNATPDPEKLFRDRSRPDRGADEQSRVHAFFQWFVVRPRTGGSLPGAFSRAGSAWETVAVRRNSSRDRKTDWLLRILSSNL